MKTPLPVYLFLTALFLICMTGTANAQQAATDSEGVIPIVKLEASEGPLDSLLLRESRKATSEGLVPVLQITADWCAPCMMLRRKMGVPKMADAFSGIYIIRVDWDDWKSELERLQIKVEGVPVFMRLSDEGRTTEEAIDGKAFYNENLDIMAPALKSFFSGIVAASKE